MWTLDLHTGVIKKLALLTKTERDRILTAFHKIQENPFNKDVIPLRDRSGWRLRIGPWRALLVIDKTDKIVRIIDIGPRGDIYK